MPISPNTICLCGGHKIGGKCDQCGNASKEDRPSASRRGYDRKWGKTRERKKRENPLNALCADCLEVGRTREAKEFHHIEKAVDCPERFHDTSNILPLCKSCHSTRTGRGE